jgi:hypothetical protein
MKGKRDGRNEKYSTLLFSTIFSSVQSRSTIVIQLMADNGLELICQGLDYTTLNRHASLVRCSDYAVLSKTLTPFTKYCRRRR